MKRILAGAALLIAGIAAFIEASSHTPAVSNAPPLPGAEEVSHLSHTAYDLLRIGAWALVIVGGLLVVTGLIRYWSAVRG